jgi:maltokinase
VIGPAGTPAPAGQAWTAYDALHDPPLTRRLLRAMVGQETIGPLSFAAEPDAAIDTGLDSLVLTTEQSNTSMLFGEEAILKVFRRPHPGPNPDLEIPRALHRAGSPHVAPPLGWVQTTLDGMPTILAILSAYLRSATDGWLLAATSVRDLYASDATCAAEAGGDFAAEAERLGEATAAVHRALAEAFGTEELPPGAYRDLAVQMQGRLDGAVAAVPELARHARLVSAAFAELAALDEPLTVQRIHGDYHLGQAIRTQAGWVLLDFEGEPARSMRERRRKRSPLRDVAGMLRSFAYAASASELLHGVAAPEDWEQRARDAFLEGYFATVDAALLPSGRAGIERLLAIFELEKAVYELRYELNNRPDWVGIPVAGIARLLEAPLPT